jgi:hypothetical protein
MFCKFLRINIYTNMLHIKNYLAGYYDYPLKPNSLYASG